MRGSSKGVPARLVIIALVGVIVIPGIIFAGILLNRFAQAERTRYQQDAREVASAARATVDQYIRSWEITLQTLGTSENLKSGNLEAFYRQASAVKAFLGAEVGLRDLDGQQLVNTRVPFGQPLPRAPQAVDQDVIASLQPSVSDVFIGAVAKKPLVAVVVPVLIGGVPRYLLHISADTDLLHAAMAPTIPEGWFVAIGDKAGVYVTRSEDHARFTGKPGIPAFLKLAVGKEGNFVGKSALGEDVLVGYVRSELTGWLIAANIRARVVEQPLWSALVGLVAGGAIALLLTSLVALLLWRLIERPLKALTTASDGLGRTSDPIEAPTRLREFIVLRDAMSDASQKIGAQSAALEAEVQARTDELRQAIASLISEAEERQRVEAMLGQAQKMEAIGNLTGGVAHDFNNLLQVVSGNLEMIGRMPEVSETMRTRLGNAMAGVARGSQLASQLLAFGRRQALAPKVVNLGRLIRGMDDLLRRTIGEAIEIETIIAGGLWNTQVDPGNVENALLNLAINARDAMDGHGKLTIESGNAFLDDAYAKLHADVTAGQYVMIGVTDTGSGMSPELAAKVFEPFFTTKPLGKGTGLGLSMVYGFVKQSGGHVKIYSEPGHGTTIKLYLPRSSAAEDLAIDAATGPVIGGSETVLVVEDDQAVRETVIGLLTELGYQVLQASNAQSALQIVESGAVIDLLFTDVVMPGPLKSAEMARQAKLRLPGLGVLFTSGYTENSIVHAGRLDEGVNLLSKPYTRDALARKLRQVLDQRMAAPRQRAVRDAAGHIVLLVEDEAIIRMDTASMIEQLGYKVLEAGSAKEALALARQEPIDILVTDIGLPDMTGEDLARAVREIRPELPVIFASGRSAIDGFADDQRVVLLKKPYQLASLETALRRFD